MCYLKPILSAEMDNVPLPKVSTHVVLYVCDVLLTYIVHTQIPSCLYNLLDDEHKLDYVGVHCGMHSQIECALRSLFELCALDEKLVLALVNGLLRLQF